MLQQTPNQNGHVPAAPAAGNPGASLMAMAQGGGGQAPAQPQFVAPQFNQPAAPQQPQFVSQANQLQLPPQQTGGFVPPQMQVPVTQQPVQLPPAPTLGHLIQPQLPQVPQQYQPGVINPMPQMLPQQQQPQYVPPFAAQPPVQQQPAPQPYGAQPYAAMGFITPQAPGAGPTPPVGVLPQAPAGGLQPPVPVGTWPNVAPPVPQQRPYVAPQQTQRDYEMQRLQSDLAQLQQQLRTAVQPQQQPGQPQGPQAQQQPQQTAPRFDFDRWPEADQLMFAEWRETRQLPNGQTVTDWKANTPVNVRMAGDQYLQHLAQWENALLYSPHKVLPELIERYATKIADRLVNERVTASENSTRVDILLGQNDWLFVTDPASGQMTLNDYGRKMVALAQYQPGKPPSDQDVRNLEHALQQVRLERERDELRQQLQAVQSGAQQMLPPGVPPQFNNGLPPGVAPMYAPVQSPYGAAPQYMHPAAAQYPQQPPLSPQANQQINQRLNQLDRMAQNTVSRTGSLPQPGAQLPSAQPQQNGRLSAGEKLLNNMRFGYAPAAA